MHYHMDTVAKGVKGLIFKIYEFFFLPIITRLAAVITCASLDYIRQSALSAYCLNHESSFMEIPFGVDAQHFTPGTPKRLPIILFVGALDVAHYFKGVQELIIAFSKISLRNPEARLVLVGKGDLESHYMSLARKKNILDKVVIDNTASDEDLAQWYKKACVLVLPSINKSEAFGLVLLEAMSSATPVIASNLPGVRNVFHNHEHGFLVKPGDVDALAEKLTYIVSNPSQARIMGDSARRWVEERYSWDKVGERLEAAYLRIAFALINHHENLPRT